MKGMVSECQWCRLRFSAHVKASSFWLKVSAMQDAVASASSGVSSVKVRGTRTAAAAAVLRGRRQGARGAAWARRRKKRDAAEKAIVFAVEETGWAII